MVRKLRYQSRTQLVLELEPRKPQTPLVSTGTKGLAEALADLLLEALAATGPKTKGGADEHQDHA
jgi:hypothetical protein